MNIASFIFNGWYLLLFILYFSIVLPWMYKTLTTPMAIAIWVFVNASPAWYGLYALRHLKKVSPVVAKKYPAFTRNDLYLQGIGNLACLVTNVLYFPRMGFCWVIVFMDLTLLYMIKIGTK